MKRKLLAVLLSCSVVLGMAACGSSTNSDTDAGSESETKTTESSDGEIRLFNSKVEIGPQLEKVAEQYSEETRQKVTVETLGGGADATGQLKSYYAAGNMPDIFVFGGDDYTANFKGMVADLSDCEFVKDTDFALMDGNQVVGFPYTIEGYGISYNADILEQAGVDPDTLTNYQAFEKAFEKIDSMKDELGLTAVCSVAAESGQMSWSTGGHLFGYYLSGGLERDDNTYFDELMEGKIDEERLTQFGKFFGLLCKYSDQQTLISGAYDDQMALWATGKAAFITQGNWIDPSLEQYDATFDCGIVPLAFTEEDMTSVCADAPSYWGVYKDSDKVQECKDFLDWLATTDEGQKGLVEECGMLSPYKSTTVSPSTPLSKSLKAYIDEGKTSSWTWADMPNGMSDNILGPIFESYAKGDIDNAGFVKMISSQVADFMSKNEK